jgi:superfamily II DNA or RNA helicase
MRVEFQYDTKRGEVKIVSEFLDNIKEIFSVKNEAAFFNKYQKFLPKRLYAITPAGYCGIGLIGEIEHQLSKLQIPFEFHYDEELRKLLASLPRYSGQLSVPQCHLQIREYQEEAVVAALTKGHGIVVVGTGGGKTFIMATLLKSIDAKLGKVLIIVPDIGLVDQTYNDFISYNIPEEQITIWTGNDEPDLTKNVIIANMGILQSKCSDLKWLSRVSVLFVDECHKLRKGNKINKLIDKIPTFNRFGFTGTLPESNLDKWNIYNQIGPVVYDKSTSDLRDLGGSKYIANASILAIHIHYDRIPDYTAVTAMEKYKLELAFIAKSPFRDKVVKGVVGKLNNNCLILVDHLEHGEKLYNILSTLTDKKVYFIQGSVEVEDRKKVQALMEIQDNVICVAVSKIFSTGISIKNIHYIMFAAGGKSKIKTLQSIGRGLRTNENKDTLIIIDLVDELIYGSKHYDKRKQFYGIEKIKIIDKEVHEAPQAS